MPLITIDPIAKASIDKAIGLQSVDQWFAAQLAEGFETPGGWALGLEASDVSLLTGNYVLSREAAAQNLQIPPIIDKAGVPHPVTINELTSIMLAYGQYRAELSVEYAARKYAVAGE